MTGTATAVAAVDDVGSGVIALPAAIRDGLVTALSSLDGVADGSALPFACLLLLAAALADRHRRDVR